MRINRKLWLKLLDRARRTSPHLPRGNGGMSSQV